MWLAPPGDHQTWKNPDPLEVLPNGTFLNTHPRACTLCAEQSCTPHSKLRVSLSADRSVRMSYKECIGRGCWDELRAEAGGAGPSEGPWSTTVSWVRPLRTEPDTRPQEGNPGSQETPEGPTTSSGCVTRLRHTFCLSLLHTSSEYSRSTEPCTWVLNKVWFLSSRGYQELTES